jgi:hypothetical protein
MLSGKCLKVIGNLRSSVVVKALCYKLEDPWFETQWGEWICFNLPNPSGRTRLGLTQPLTEMSTRSREVMFLGVKRGRCVGLTTLPPSVSLLCSQYGIFNISQLCRFTVCYEDSFTFNRSRERPRHIRGVILNLLENRRVWKYRLDSSGSGWIVVVYFLSSVKKLGRPIRDFRARFRWVNYSDRYCEKSS